MSTEPDRPDPITRVTDHGDRMRRHLMARLRKPNILAWLASYARQVQELEDALWALLVETLESGIGGVSLDQIGALLGLERGATADGPYRALLRAAARLRRARGGPPDLIAAAKLALDTIAFTYEEGSASILVSPAEPLPFPAAQLRKVLGFADPGGVQLHVLDPVASAAAARFDPADSEAADLVHGWGDETETTGGQWAGVVE